MGLLGRIWGTRDELLHPRGPDGRWIKKAKMAEKVVDQVSGILDNFSYRRFESNGQASQYLFNRAKPGRFSGGRDYARFVTDFNSVQEDLRDGHIDNPSTAKYIKMMDDAAINLPDDLVLSKVVPPEAFGLNAQTVGDPEHGIAGQIGNLVADRGYSSMKIGQPIPGPPGSLRMVVATPKGTKAIIPSQSVNDAEIVLDRDQEMRITKVYPDGHGGYFVMAVATPRTPGQTPAPMGGHVGEGVSPQDREARISLVEMRHAARGQGLTTREQRQIEAARAAPQPAAPGPIERNPPVPANENTVLPTEPSTRPLRPESVAPAPEPTPAAPAANVAPAPAEHPQSGQPSPLGPTPQGEGAPAPRTEQVAHPATGLSTPRTAQPGPGAAPSPEPQAPGGAEGAAPSAASFRQATQHLEAPTARGPERRAFNDAFTRVASGKAHPADVLRDLEADIRNAQDDKAELQVPGGQSGVAAERRLKNLNQDIPRLQKLADSIREHFKVGGQQETPNAPAAPEAPAIAPTKAVAKKLAKAATPAPPPERISPAEANPEPGAVELRRQAEVSDNMARLNAQKSVKPAKVKEFADKPVVRTPQEQSVVDDAVVRRARTLPEVNRNSEDVRIKQHAARVLKERGETVPPGWADAKLAGAPEPVKATKAAPTKVAKAAPVKAAKAAPVKAAKAAPVKAAKAAPTPAAKAAPVKAAKAAPSSVAASWQEVLNAPNAAEKERLAGEMTKRHSMADLRAFGAKKGVNARSKGELMQKLFADEAQHPTPRSTSAARTARLAKAAPEKAAPAKAVKKAVPEKAAPAKAVKKAAGPGPEASADAKWRHVKGAKTAGEMQARADEMARTTSFADIRALGAKNRVTGRSKKEILEKLAGQGINAPAKKAAPPAPVKAVKKAAAKAMPQKAVPAKAVAKVAKKAEPIKAVKAAPVKAVKAAPVKAAPSTNAVDRMLGAKTEAEARTHLDDVANSRTMAEVRALGKEHGVSGRSKREILDKLVADRFSPEAAARREVAGYDKLRAQVPALGSLESVLHGQGSDRAVSSALEALRKAGAPEADINEMKAALKAGDRAKLTKLGDAMLRRQGISKIGTIGRGTNFNPSTHNPLGFTPEKTGQRVHVLSPGFQAKGPSGNTAILKRAEVGPAGGVAKAVKAAPVKAPAKAAKAAARPLRADEPLVRPGFNEPARVRQFNEAVKNADIKVPGTLARRSLTEVFTDVKSGKITPSEGARRLDSEVEFQRADLGRLEQELHRINALPESMRNERDRRFAGGELKDQIDLYKGNIAGHEKGAAFLRKTFNEGAAPQHVIEIPVPASDLEKMRKASPESIREAARINGLGELEGNSNEELLNSAVTKLVQRQLGQKSVPRVSKAASPIAPKATKAAPAVKATKAAPAVKATKAAPAVKAAPVKAAPAKAGELSPKAAETLSKLNNWENPPSREEGLALLAEHGKADLTAMARRLNVIRAGSLNMQELRREIVNSTNGHRLDSIATRGFRGSRPDENPIRSTKAVKAAQAEEDFAKGLRTLAKGGFRNDKSTKPILENHWGSTGGEINFHEDGAIGQAIHRMGDDKTLDVGGEPVANVLGRIATDLVRGNTTSNEAIGRLRKVAHDLPPTGAARTQVEEAIRNIDTPVRSPLALPAHVPEPMHQLMKDLSEIPLARKSEPGRPSEMDLLKAMANNDSIVRSGRSPALIAKDLRSKLSNKRHESEEGKFEIDRAVTKAANALEKMPRRPATPTEVKANAQARKVTPAEQGAMDKLAKQAETRARKTTPAPEAPVAKKTAAPAKATPAKKMTGAVPSGQQAQRGDSETVMRRLGNMTITELKQQAQQLGIGGAAGMGRSELLEKLADRLII